MIRLKNLSFPCLFLAALIMNDPSFSKAPPSSPAQKTEAQSKGASNLKIEEYDPKYVNAACTCAREFAYDYGATGAKWLFTKAIEQTPKLLEIVCKKFILTLCDSDMACNVDEAIKIENFMKEHWDKCHWIK